MGLEKFLSLNEIISERTYNQKVYDNSDEESGSKRYRIHCRHLHYKNGAGFEDIDTHLAYDSTKKVWKHNKASYHPVIPEYADSWFEFANKYEGADHVIKAKPVCGHVQGEKLPDQHDGLGADTVIYRDAFGSDIDLKVCAYWSALKKIISLNKKPDDTAQELHFDFELDLSDCEVKNDQDKRWDKQKKLTFKDKKLCVGKNGKYSYFRSARIWDSGQPTYDNPNPQIKIPVDIELYTANGKTYLRKTIKKEILERATYPLFTDHPTNYYTGAGDGEVTTSGLGTTWAEVHDAVTGDQAVDGATVSEVASEWLGLGLDRFQIERAYFPIDTSGIGAGATITAAVLNVKPNSDVYNMDDDGQDYTTVVETFQASTSELIRADYIDCGSDNGTAGRAKETPIEKGSNDLDFDQLSAGVYAQWTLNATGRGWINKTGTTKIGLREGHDIENTPVNTNDVVENSWRPRTSEYANTGSDPYLDVTVSVSTEDYSAGNYINLPSNDDDLESGFVASDYTKVQTDDNSRFEQDNAIDKFAVNLFKDKSSLTQQSEFTITWIGHSELAPLSSPIILQIYNRTTPSWEEVARNETDPRTDADITLQATIGASGQTLSDYYDVNGWIACRIYQDMNV